MTRQSGAPTLHEVREVLNDVYHEIDNRGGKDDVGGDGPLFFRTHELLRWLLDEYLRRGEFVEAG